MKGHTLHQSISGFAAGLTVLAIGSTVGWTTVALKELRSAGSEIPITPSEGSWIASAHELGHIFSPLPVGYILGKIGPKKCMIFSAVIQTLGWTLITTTRSVPILYFVRFLFGVSMGTVFTVTPLYIGEISNSEVRGALSTGFETMLYLGHVIEFAIGPFVSYNTLAEISVMIPLGFLIISFWMAESPYFLLKKKRYLEARKTYSKLSGIDNEQIIINQLARIEEHIDDSRKSSLRDLFGSRVYSRSLMIVLVLALVQRFSGMSAVVAYASFVFPSTIGGLSSSDYTILFGIITLMFTFVSAALMDRSGRRVLTIISCLGSFLAEFLTALYFFLQQNSIVDVTHVTWLPFITISMYAGFYSVGLGPIVTIVQGELFPPNVKGLASSIVAIVHGVSSSLVTKSYQIVSDSFGVYVSFWIFSINCLIGSIFAYVIMPETKGKSLLELQSLL